MRRSSVRTVPRRACARHIKLKSYPCLELGGIIWTYMGPDELRPETARSSNGLWSPRSTASPPSGLAGMQLSAGLGRRHRFEPRPPSFIGGALKARSALRRQQGQPLQRGAIGGRSSKRSPNSTAELLIGARRDADAGAATIGASRHGSCPCFTLIPPRGGTPDRRPRPGSRSTTRIAGRGSISYHPRRPACRRGGGRGRCGAGPRQSTSNTSPGTFVPRANKRNDYLMDRKGPRPPARPYRRIGRRSAMQDASLQESMGPISGPAPRSIWWRPTSAIITTPARLVACGQSEPRRARGVPGVIPASQRVRSCALELARPMFGSSDGGAPWLVLPTPRQRSGQRLTCLTRDNTAARSLIAEGSEETGFHALQKGCHQHGGDPAGNRPRDCPEGGYSTSGVRKVLAARSWLGDRRALGHGMPAGLRHPRRPSKSYKAAQGCRPGRMTRLRFLEPRPVSASKPLANRQGPRPPHGRAPAVECAGPRAAIDAALAGHVDAVGRGGRRRSFR